MTSIDFAQFITYSYDKSSKLKLFSTQVDDLFCPAFILTFFLNILYH
jgi:hypothetical protein